MSKSKLAVLTLVVLVLSSFYVKKKDKCDRENLIEEAIPKLKKFTYMQDYPFSFKKKKKNGTIEYSKHMITLNRGIRYKFYAVRNDEYEGVPVVAIYNNEKQEFLLGTTYNSNLKKFYDEIEFECKTTGNYCVSFSFFDGMEGCGLGIFSSYVKDIQ